MDGTVSSSVTAVGLSSIPSPPAPASVSAAGGASREASLRGGGVSPWGVQSVNLVIFDAFHFGSASNEGSSSSSSPLSYKTAHEIQHLIL